MKYQEFVCAVEKEMNARLEGGAGATIYNAVKNNGTQKSGIIVACPGINLSPAIYLEDFYQRFLSGTSLGEIIEELLRFYETIKCEESCKIPDLKIYENVRDKIVFRVIHTEKNKTFLKGIPHIPFLDLSIVFYVLLEMRETGGSMATVLIHNEYLHYWAKEKEELFTVACENVVRLFPAQLFTMEQTLEGIICTEPGDKKNLLDTQIKGCDAAMYVLSNPQASYGAACIAYPDVLKKVGEILGDDFYILPSSVHEVVLVPKSKAMESYLMDEIVEEINATQVADEDVLSDHVYFYEKETESLLLRQPVKEEN